MISASKRADQLQAAVRLERRLDTYVNRTDDVLKRRLADYVKRSDGAGDVGRTAVRRGDDLGDAARVKAAMLHSDDVPSPERLQKRLGYYAAKNPTPTDNPYMVAGWVQQKSDAGEVDDIIDWIRKYDDQANIDDVAEAQLRQDLLELGEKFERGVDGPPSEALRKAMINSMNAHEVTRAGK